MGDFAALFKPSTWADEGAMIERFFVGPDALIGPLDGSFRRGISPPAGGRGVPPCGAGFFLDAQKETKEAPGRRSGRTLRVHIRGPWTPFLRGRQLGKLSGHRKGAGGQRIGFRSMTAAAEFPVTFGWYPYRLEARLLGWWGSSSAQRDGGRVRAPAPTADMETAVFFT